MEVIPYVSAVNNTFLIHDLKSNIFHYLDFITYTATYFLKILTLPSVIIWLLQQPCVLLLSEFFSHASSLRSCFTVFNFIIKWFWLLVECAISKWPGSTSGVNQTRANWNTKESRIVSGIKIPTLSRLMNQ